MSEFDPIEIDSDDEYEGIDRDFEVLGVNGPRTRPESLSDEDIIDLTYETTTIEDPAFFNDGPSCNPPLVYPWVQEQRTVKNGHGIRVNDTVELKRSHRMMPPGDHSGDFLRIKHIYRNVETEEIMLRGYLLRRAKYFQQAFDWKLNELVMLLDVMENDKRTYKEQGMTDQSLRNVKRIRKVIITELPYPRLSYRDFPTHVQFSTGDEYKTHVFGTGRLVCRWVYVKVYRENKKTYEGEIRRIFRQESDYYRKMTVRKGHGPQNPISIDGEPWNNSPSQPLDRSSSVEVIETGSLGSFFSKRLERSPSVEIINRISLGGLPSRQRVRSLSIEMIEGGTLNGSPTRRSHRSPSLEIVSSAITKNSRSFTFGDVFCGAGGASRGAANAGLRVVFGLDKEPIAIEAYKANFPGALIYNVDAHDFLEKSINTNLVGLDILHLSPPCCYFSPVHTRAGRNDQANLEALYTVAPLLEKLKPRIATMEETMGLINSTVHSNTFRALLNQLNQAGYNVRYKLANLAEYGLAQPRKRLLIIAAQQGIPLPEFPIPTHGPLGSALEGFRYVWDALAPIRSASPVRLLRDPYHQPDLLKEISKESYDPKTSFVPGCITGAGGEGWHWSGTRKHTVRENALLQSFPIDHQFRGTKTQAMLQVGNAYPPIMAEKVFRRCIQTLTAFDEGLIKPEDDLSKVHEYFDERGNLQKRVNTPKRNKEPVTPKRFLKRHRHLILDSPTSPKRPKLPDSPNFLARRRNARDGFIEMLGSSTPSPSTRRQNVENNTIEIPGSPTLSPLTSRHNAKDNFIEISGSPTPSPFGRRETAGDGVIEID